LNQARLWRRRLAAILVVWVAGQVPVTSWAADGLNTPAIAVRAPERVVLIAITNAGTRLVAAGEHGVIIYSDDNGKNWTQARVPVDVTLTALSFATPLQGWAAGHYGAILHTVDGGATWQLQLDGNQANQLTLAAAQAALADQDKSPAASLAILRANHFVADGPDKPFLSVLATSASQVTVFGAYRMVMHSDDAGKTWVDWSLRIGDRLSHHLYDAAVIGNRVCIAAEAGNVFCSSDGGGSFPAASPPGTGTLLGLLPTGDGGMIGFGVAGLAYRSEDGGQSWSSVPVGAQSDLTAGRVLRSGAIMLACEDGSLYVSQNHGNSFQVLRHAEPMAVFDLAQAPDGDVILVGSGGVISLPIANLNRT